MSNFHQASRAAESARIAAVIQAHGGDARKAAKELGISKTTLYRRLQGARETLPVTSHPYVTLLTAYLRCPPEYQTLFLADISARNTTKTTKPKPAS